MRKSAELASPQSCLNRAAPEELLFVLLARDPAAPAAIRAWVAERIRLGKNLPDDPQLAEALECARLMDVERTPPVANPSDPTNPHPGRKAP